MADLGVQPLVGPPDVEPIPDPDARGWSLEGGVGAGKLLETAATAPGTKKEAKAFFCLHPNQKDGFCLGLQIEAAHNDANPSTDAADHDRYVLVAKKIDKKSSWLEMDSAFYVGKGDSNGASTIELGNDLLSLTAFIPSDAFEVGLNLSLTHFVASTSDSNEENVPLQDLEAGATVVVRIPDTQTISKPEGVEDEEVIYDDLAGAQRLWKAYEATNLTEESEKLKKYFDQYKEGDEEELPSAITEGVPAIEGLNSVGAAASEGGTLELLLNGTDGQQMGLGIPKGVYTLGYCGLGADDEGISLQTQCIAGGLTLIFYGIGRVKKLDRPRRSLLTESAQQKNADDFLLYRMLMSAGIFAIGGVLLGTDEQWGAILAAAGQQEWMATALVPDPARTNMVLSTAIDGVYEYGPEGGSVGGQVTKHLRHHLFAQTRVIAQALPVRSDDLQEEINKRTGRDPALEAAQAATLATIGFETAGYVNLSGGIQGGLIRGREKPLALLGIQEQLTLSSGEYSGVEAGIGATQGIIPGAPPGYRLRLSYMGFFGGRFK